MGCFEQNAGDGGCLHTVSTGNVPSACCAPQHAFCRSGFQRACTSAMIPAARRLKQVQQRVVLVSQRSASTPSTASSSKDEEGSALAGSAAVEGNASTSI